MSKPGLQSSPESYFCQINHVMYPLIIPQDMTPPTTTIMEYLSVLKIEYKKHAIIWNGRRQTLNCSK